MKISNFIKTTTIKWEEHVASIIYVSDEGNIDFSEIIDYIKGRNGIIDSVIIDGDEPAHYREIVQLIKELKSMKLKIKIMTAGKCPNSIDDLIGACYVDAIGMNIENKSITEEMKKTIDIILDTKIEHEFDITLNPMNVTYDDVIAISHELKGAKKLTLLIPKNLPPNVKAFSKSDINQMIQSAKSFVKDVKAITV